MMSSSRDAIVSQEYQYASLVPAVRTRCEVDGCIAQTGECRVTTGGEATNAVLEMILLDRDGKTKYDWRRCKQ